MQKFRWDILHKEKAKNIEDIVNILLQNREIDNQSEFLNPSEPENYSEKLLPDISKAHDLIMQTISANAPIVIHGDYDVDGQTATAILWRTIHNDLEYKNVFPYIPNRFDEGYGLSTESLNGITTLLKEKGFKDNKSPLLITVDCGIVSIDEVNQAKSKGFKVIVTDHHHPKNELPDADVLLATEQATGAGIAWLLANHLSNKNSKKYLGLAALGTICDLQPLTEFNRSVAKYGLIELNKNPLLGITALINVGSQKANAELDTYHVGWVIGPRLNASGRLESAMESLRLLCTDSETQATELAQNLDFINRQRQDQTEYNLKIALDQYKDTVKMPKFIISAHETYHEGVIGLVAGKLTQQFYRPSIAISIESNSEIAKGSARSISGISIIESLRKFEELFINVGGHEMAAGFSIKKTNISKLEEGLNSLDEWPEEIFNKKLTIDTPLDSNLISRDTYEAIDKLKPFGVGNYEPVFCSSEFRIINFSIFGKENNHLRLFLEMPNNEKITAIAFGDGYLADKINLGDTIDIAYNLSLNTWNGNSNLELKVKDLKEV